MPRNAGAVGLLAVFIWSSGCRDMMPGNESSADHEATATAPATQPSESRRPQPMDAEDDEDAPRALPRSMEVGNWIKTEPARVARGDEAATLVGDDAVQAVLAEYHVRQVARCTYQSPYATVRMLLVEMASPADAFGAFSVLNPHAGCTPQPDGSLRGRVERGDSLRLFAWQGDILVMADCGFEPDADLDKSRQNCDRLVTRTIFSVPAADPPLLVQAVANAKGNTCDVWLVRSARTLAHAAQPALSRLDLQRLDERLGLDGEAVLSVVSIEAGATRSNASRSNDSRIVIWLAEYPDAQRAQAAAKRYSQATQPAGDTAETTSESATPAEALTLIAPPAGRCVVGTWTADNPAAREMVATLAEALGQH